MLMRTYRQHRWSKNAPWKVCLRNFNVPSDDFVQHSFGIAHMKHEFDEKYSKMEGRLLNKYCPRLSRMIFDGIKGERFCNIELNK